MKLYESLEKQLKKEPNYVTDSGELKKWVVINKAQNYDGDKTYTDYITRHMQFSNNMKKWFKMRNNNFKT